jgi:hypothetical protein
LLCGKGVKKTKVAITATSLMLCVGLSGHSVSAADSAPAPRVEGPTGGYVAGNFGISAQIVTGDHGPITYIKVNPPTLGVWLQNFARGELWLRKAGHTQERLKLTVTEESRLFPEYQATFSGPDGVRASVKIFAPLGLDSSIGFLPGLITQIQLNSDHPWKGEIGYTLRKYTVAQSEDDDSRPWPAQVRRIQSDRLSAIIRGEAFLAVDRRNVADLSADPDSSELTVTVPIVVARSATAVTFVAGAYSSNGYYAKKAPSAPQLVERLVSHQAELHGALRDFIDALPRSGDAKIDEYLRWYASAGILLTKGTRAGDVLTMGYRELNQRDSFWTSGIHMVFWKDLERQMVLESARGQTAAGQIPTTILPTIDRNDQIDILEYFILRVARDYRWYRDDELLIETWPSIKRGIEYLVGRDIEHVGVPAQISYWADWEEAPFNQGRKYAPHFALLWIAALRAATELAHEICDESAESRYADLANRASEFVNSSYEKGGLWAGTRYLDQWYDGWNPPFTQEDQVVGAYFHVIPPDRLQTIYNTLKASESPRGVIVQYPDPAGYRGLEDAQIWPYLNFVDAAGRYLNSRPEEAESIIHRVGAADLDSNSDDKPGEWINAVTGANEGFEIQGWDADLFSAIYFGGLGIERTSRNEIAIRVHFPKRNFTTRIVLPDCSVVLSRQDGKLSWTEEHAACKQRGIAVSPTQDEVGLDHRFSCDTVRAY